MKQKKNEQNLDLVVGYGVGIGLTVSLDGRVLGRNCCVVVVLVLGLAVGRGVNLEKQIIFFYFFGIVLYISFFFAYFECMYRFMDSQYRNVAVSFFLYFAFLNLQRKKCSYVACVHSHSKKTTNEKNVLKANKKIK